MIIPQLPDLSSGDWARLIYPDISHANDAPAPRGRLHGPFLFGARPYRDRGGPEMSVSIEIDRRTIANMLDGLSALLRSSGRIRLTWVMNVRLQSAVPAPRVCVGGGGAPEFSRKKPIPFVPRLL